MAKSNQNGQSNQGYDPMLYSNNNKGKGQQQQQQPNYQYGQYSQPYGGQPGYNNNAYGLQNSSQTSDTNSMAWQSLSDS